MKHRRQPTEDEDAASWKRVKIVEEVVVELTLPSKSLISIALATSPSKVMKVKIVVAHFIGNIIYTNGYGMIFFFYREKSRKRTKKWWNFPSGAKPHWLAWDLGWGQSWPFKKRQKGGKWLAWFSACSLVQGKSSKEGNNRRCTCCGIAKASRNLR